jgi:hypothetical protein
LGLLDDDDDDDDDDDEDDGEEDDGDDEEKTSSSSRIMAMRCQGVRGVDERIQRIRLAGILALTVGNSPVHTLPWILSHGRRGSNWKDYWVLSDGAAGIS